MKEAVRERKNEKGNSNLKLAVSLFLAEQK